MPERPEVSVLGAGNWGTTLAHLIGQNGNHVTLWCRREEQAKEINQTRRNERYLKGINLSPRITATTDLAHAIRQVGTIFFVIPSKEFRSVCGTMGPLVTPDQVVIHATKGIEAGTLKRMSEILLEETCLRQVGVLSGPNIAHEICQGKPAGTVVASRFPRVIHEGQRLLVSSQLRVYSNDDIVGVELGGALKNVVAIAAGMATGMQVGENAKALLLTRGLSEIARLGVSLGAQPSTFSGLAGIGDLIVTCASTFSRNHQVGFRLSRGESLREIVESLGMVAEGVNTALVAHELINSRKIDAPLLEAIYRVVHEDVRPSDAILELMSISSQHDVDRVLR